MQNDHPKMIKLLILLAHFDVPVKVKDMNKAAKAAGFKVPRAWNFETILKSGDNLAQKANEGWLLTDKGFELLKKMEITPAG